MAPKRSQRTMTEKCPACEEQVRVPVQLPGRGEQSKSYFCFCPYCRAKLKITMPLITVKEA